MLFEYLEQTYRPNEPIIASDISYNGMSQNLLRQQLKKLTDAGVIKRYDKGIFYIPKASVLKLDIIPSKDDVIKKKYLVAGTDVFGYISGLEFASLLGLTTQVPMQTEVVTNKATRRVREVSVGGFSVKLRKPRTFINQDNYCAMQLLDLVNDIDSLSELTGRELQKAISDYMDNIGLEFCDLLQYLDLYPDKIYKNLFEVGVLYGISA